MSNKQKCNHQFAEYIIPEFHKKVIMCEKCGYKLKKSEQDKLKPLNAEKLYK